MLIFVDFQRLYSPKTATVERAHLIPLSVPAQWLVIYTSLFIRNTDSTKRKENDNNKNKRSIKTSTS